jgi:hypothetical protein
MQADVVAVVGSINIVLGEIDRQGGADGQLREAGNKGEDDTGCRQIGIGQA